MGVYSKYKGVSFDKTVKNGKKWIMQFNHRLLGKSIIKSYQTEREAAIAYDIKRIEFGLEPINILKRK